MAHKVVLTVDIGPTQLEEEALRDIGATFIKAPSLTEDAIIKNCRDADAVLIGPNEPFTKRVIDSLTNLKVISRMGIGYDNIDVAAATERGIPVSIVPDYCIDEVSDHAMAFVLALARKMLPLNRAVREGRWKAGSTETSQMARPIRRLQGQTLGIVGLGRIGKALAAKAKGFELKVIAYDPYLSQSAARRLDVASVELDSLLAQSDYVSIHAPLTSQTRHLMNLDAFKKMKPSAYVINCARGALIDERALFTALSQGLIAGAAIDVTDPEPPAADNPLLQLDNIIITPHSSWYSQESVLQLRQESIKAVVQVLRGHWPRVLANLEVRDHR